MNTKGTVVAGFLFSLTTLAFFSVGEGFAQAEASQPLSATAVNLIFVVSPDLDYGASDVQPQTANLTGQGLGRSLLLGQYLKQKVLGAKNVTGITTLEPMTHLQTANQYPDMAAMTYAEQFAMLNQFTLPQPDSTRPSTKKPETANSFPINQSPTLAAVGTQPFVGCGLQFANTNANVALVTGILQSGKPGFYVFVAPWETTKALMAALNRSQGYDLPIPTSYPGLDKILAISVVPKGSATLVTYDAKLKPADGYPKLPQKLPKAACPGPHTTPPRFHISLSGTLAPAGINRNQTTYLIRHAEAHPTQGWDDGNYVAAGQWRAIGLPHVLSGKIRPTQVYSIDPAQMMPRTDFSYVRPSLTVAPYATANGLPYRLISSIKIFDPGSGQKTSQFLFFEGTFSNQTILMAWEHEHIPHIVSALLKTYAPADGGVPQVPSWPSSDYDTIWTVTIDAEANLTVNNDLCEGIDSAKLPSTAPIF
jgi:hypothetical protein